MFWRGGAEGGAAAACCVYPAAKTLWPFPTLWSYCSAGLLLTHLYRRGRSASMGRVKKGAKWSAGSPSDSASRPAGSSARRQAGSRQLAGGAYPRVQRARQASQRRQQAYLLPAHAACGTAHCSSKHARTHACMPHPMHAFALQHWRPCLRSMRPPSAVTASKYRSTTAR